MKTILSALLFTAVFAGSTAAHAQEDKSKRPSPPAELKTTINGADITLNYSQPSVKGRAIGGKEIATYDSVWRTGANEATTFETSKDVMIEGKELKAGKYALFTIPTANNWTLIFNKEPNQWGAFKYNMAQDALRVEVPSMKAPSFTERMTFAKKDEKIALMWGDTEVDFSVK